MVSRIEFKKYVFNIYIFNIFINKFYYNKKSYLIILFKINKSSKIRFYNTILPFNLADYLKIKDN